MGKQTDRTLAGYLPLVLAATFVVVVAPTLLVLWLRTSGAVTSVWAGTALAVALSLLLSYAGAAFWKTRTGSRDILFADLMLWGWVQRRRSQRRLSAASDLLGLTTGRPQAIPGRKLTNDQKASLLRQLSSGLEARDPYTHGHSRRVARHAASIAKRMGLSRDEVAKIRAAGAMHDVGKVETPISVLHKEGALTAPEFAVIKRHPVDGARMVSTLADDELTAMVRHHHERLDGTGYPDRLSGEAIPIGARILAVADTFDAITSTRPYRHAHPHKKALDILTAEAGTQLDPDAVRAFRSCYSGRRPLAYWTMLVNLWPRLPSLLGSGIAPAKAATVVNGMATAATAVAVGGAIAGLATPAKPSHPATARADSRAVAPAVVRQAAFKQPRSTRAPAKRSRAVGARRRDARRRTHVLNLAADRLQTAGALAQPGGSQPANGVPAPAIGGPASSGSAPIAPQQPSSGRAPDSPRHRGHAHKRKPTKRYKPHGKKQGPGHGRKPKSNRGNGKKPAAPNWGKPPKGHAKKPGGKPAPNPPPDHGKGQAPSGPPGQPPSAPLVPVPLPNLP